MNFIGDHFISFGNKAVMNIHLARTVATINQRTLIENDFVSLPDRTITSIDPDSEDEMFEPNSW